MSDLNIVIIEGNLVKAAELSRWDDGTPYCNFTIANNESYKQQDGTYNSIASFFDCVMKGAYAEAMSKHLLKGRGCKVVGRLKQQRWEKDGQKYSRIILKVDELHLNPVRNNDGSQTSQQQSYQQPAVAQPEPAQEYIPFNAGPEQPMLDEDIPF